MSKQELGHTQTVDDAIALVNDAVIKETNGDEHIIRLKGDMLSGFGGSMDIVREKIEGVANIKGNMARQIIGGLLSAAFKMGSAPLLSRVSQLESDCRMKDEALRFVKSDPCYSALGSVTHDTLDAALSDAQPDAVQAGGYVLVPLEPTRAMTMAACSWLPSCEHVFGHAGKLCADVYRQMIKAAPKPASPPPPADGGSNG